MPPSLIFDEVPICCRKSSIVRGLHWPPLQPCGYLCLHAHKTKYLTWFLAATLWNSVVQPYFRGAVDFVSKCDAFVLQLKKGCTCGEQEAGSFVREHRFSQTLSSRSQRCMENLFSDDILKSFHNIAIMLYSLNSYNAVCELYLSKTWENTH